MRIANSPVMIAALVACSAPVLGDVVDVSVSPENAVTGGVWRTRVVRGDQLTSCGYTDGSDTMYFFEARVENESSELLECTFNLSARNARGYLELESSSTKILVTPRAKRPVLGHCFDAEDTPELTAECLPRPRYPTRATPGGCQYKIDPPLGLAEYYPKAARRDWEQGPVTVSVLLPQLYGRPSEVNVEEKSLSPALDEAAVKVAWGSKFLTTCAGTRFQFTLGFELARLGPGVREGAVKVLPE